MGIWGLPDSGDSFWRHSTGENPDGKFRRRGDRYPADFRHTNGEESERTAQRSAASRSKIIFRFSVFFIEIEIQNRYLMHH